MEGGSISFYLTMKDGTEHQVGNLGNTYLYIDGDYYDAGYEWLSSWAQDYGEGNARLPQGFLGEAGDDAMAKFQAKIIEMEEGVCRPDPYPFRGGRVSFRLKGWRYRRDNVQWGDYGILPGTVRGGLPDY